MKVSSIPALISFPQGAGNLPITYTNELPVASVYTKAVALRVITTKSRTVLSILAAFCLRPELIIPAKRHNNMETAGKLHTISITVPPS
jgi:hypothetical protein